MWYISFFISRGCVLNALSLTMISHYCVCAYIRRLYSARVAWFSSGSSRKTVGEGNALIKDRQHFPTSRKPEKSLRSKKSCPLLSSEGRQQSWSLGVTVPQVHWFNCWPIVSLRTASADHLLRTAVENETLQRNCSIVAFLMNLDNYNNLCWYRKQKRDIFWRFKQK